MNEGERAVLYRSLARLLDAGLPPDTLYSMLGKGFRSEAVRAVIAACREAALDGRPLSDGLRASAPAVPPLHALAVGAAEAAGTVPDTLKELAVGDEERLRARRGLLGSALYPILLVHLAVIAPNGGLLVTDLSAFLLRVVPAIVAIDLALLFGWRLLARPVEGTPGHLLLRVPVVGQLLRAASYRGYFRALSALYEAGVPLPRAARESTVTLSPPALREAVSVALEPVDRHEPLAEAWPGFPGLREEVRASLVTAEPAGELGTALAGAAAVYAELETTLRARVVRIGSAVLYAAGVLYVAVRVIVFYTEYFGKLNSF